jgi:dienelactone hydrolase
MTNRPLFRRHYLTLAVLTLSVLLLLSCGGQAVSSGHSPDAGTTTTITWSPTAAPKGVHVPGAEWLKIVGAGGTSANVQFAAVFRPKGPGPFPLVVLFHGSNGLTDGLVSIAAQLTAGSFIVVVGCWLFSGPGSFVDQGVSYQNVPCPDSNARDLDAAQALIEVGQQLPGVKKNAMGLFGLSAGAGLVFKYAATGTDVGAIVVDSPVGCVQDKLTAPVLILGGTDDGGIASQQACEQVMRDFGISVESHFYDGGKHGVIFGDFSRDAIGRTLDFFKRSLG